MIVGSQHFVTFDQRHYDFKGHCSYLLANDFVGREFSLVMNYESDTIGRYTLLLLLGTHETVSIDLQRKVSFFKGLSGFKGFECRLRDYITQILNDKFVNHDFRKHV